MIRYVIILILLLFTSLLKADRPLFLNILASPDHEEILKVNQTRVDKLVACGFEVKTIPVKSIKKYSDEMQSEKVKNALYALVDGHGNNRQGDYNSEKCTPYLMNEGSVTLNANELFNEMDKASPHLSTWIDTCHSGSFLECTNKNIGTSCGAEQKAVVKSKFTDFILDLMCSSIGDCKEWQLADKDGRGVLSASEIRQYLINKLGKRVESLAFPIDNPDTKKQMEFISNCDRHEGKFKKVDLGYKYEVIYDRDEEKNIKKSAYDFLNGFVSRSATQLKNVNESSNYAFSDENFKKSYFQICAFKEYCKKYKNIRFQRVGNEVISGYTCDLNLPYDLTLKGDTSLYVQERLQLPELSQFNLKSDRCRTKPSSTAIKYPGLKHREIEMPKLDSH